MGVPEKVDMLTVETGHGLGAEKRQKLASWFKRWLKDNQSPVKKAAQDRFQLSDMLCTTKGQVNVSMPGALSIMQENVNQLDEWASKRETFLSKGKKTVQTKMLDLLGLKGLPDHKIRIEATAFSRAALNTLITFLQEPSLRLLSLSPRHDSSKMSS